jgi:hypothetical protein
MFHASMSTGKCSTFGAKTSIFAWMASWKFPREKEENTVAWVLSNIACCKMFGLAEHKIWWREEKSWLLHLASWTLCRNARNMARAIIQQIFPLSKGAFGIPWDASELQLNLSFCGCLHVQAVLWYFSRWKWFDAILWTMPTWLRSEIATMTMFASVCCEMQVKKHPPAVAESCDPGSAMSVMRIVRRIAILFSIQLVPSWILPKECSRDISCGFSQAQEHCVFVHCVHS